MRQDQFNQFTAAIRSSNIAAINDQTLFFEPFTGNVEVPHGTVMAANDANFDATYLSEPLQEYIVGAPEDQEIQATLDVLFPSITVGRHFSYRVHDTREQFQDDGDNDADVRQIGGDFAEIRRTGTQADGRTDNKGLVMILDNDQGGEDNRVQQRAVLNLRTRLMRTELRRGLLMIDASATSTAKNWGPTASAPDPDTDVLTAIDSGGDARGLDSNIVVYGKSARIKRITCLRSKTNPDQVGAALTDGQLAAFFNVENVETVRSRRQVSSSSKGKMVGDAVYSYYVNKTAMPDDPSNIKRFVSMTPGGMLRIYVIPKLKRTIVAVEHYSRLVLTSALGIQKLAITYT